ncbi:katanin p80 WD40 repeat-containing subunit B1-like [Scleropages formosus]|uniref:Katanin p80 WD40 repeat-containing subunit B1-like n=1 Tax=Scleropages formosus TaxID=113540 RepID=A0A0P7ZG56_SCLFO|nr:katanin p80 WD40 repeat-containing subunit B1-like [Scleropages formosus]
MAGASATKTSWKLQEIVAHSSNVSSLALGKTSGRLLATGGEDCLVNIWAVSKPNCIMRLTGHNNPVECIQFSSSEEQVVAGSQSGSLRVWDLEAAKSEFEASGFNSVCLCLWDVRRKGCVFRYKGHTQAVRCLAFSPDGKWLASSSDDSTIKLWDLTAGKMITEFTAHTGAVNIIQFHPNEYLLASGSSDRTIKLWDLEKFKLIGSSEGETGPVRCFLTAIDIFFSIFPLPFLFSSYQIGVSYQFTNVSSYVVDLNRVKKSGSVIQGLIQDDKLLPEPTPKGATIRRNYDRPLTTCTNQRVKQNAESERRSPEGERRSPSSEDEREEKESTAEIHNAEDYKEIFQPKNAISRTPPRRSEPFPAPPEDESFLVKQNSVLEVMTPMPEKLTSGHLKSAPVASSTPVIRVEPTVVTGTSRQQPAVVHPARPPPVVSPAAATAQPRPEPAVIFSSRNEPIGLNVSDFLPVMKNHKPSALSDEDAMSQIRKGHDTMCVMLTSRLKNLDTVRSVWNSGDVKTSLDCAVAINDLSIVVDILNIINLKPSLWKLDLCTSILPQIEELLQSKYERLQKCKACYKQLKNLSNLVKNKAGLVGRHGSAFRELQLLMAPLDY